MFKNMILSIKGYTFCLGGQSSVSIADLELFKNAYKKAA